MEETAWRHSAAGASTNLWPKGWTASDPAKPDPGPGREHEAAQRPMELPTPAAFGHRRPPDAAALPP